MSDSETSVSTLVMLVVAGIVLLAFAGGIVFLGVGNANTAEQRIDDAVDIDAEIVDSEIDFERRDGERRWYANVEFRYEYEGTTYRSDLLYPTTTSKRFDERAGAISVRDDFPEGETVVGYVDPAHPDEAFLNDESASSPFVYYIAGAASALFSLVFLGDAIRRYRT